MKLSILAMMLALPLLLASAPQNPKETAKVPA